MTYEELIANPDFIGFCEKWKADRWCPAPLVEWLLERGMPLQAEAARWAVNTEERFSFYNSDDKRLSRVYPLASKTNGSFAFTQIIPAHGKLDCDHVPVDRVLYFNSQFHLSVAEYFFSFSPEIAAKYPPKECIV